MTAADGAAALLAAAGSVVVKVGSALLVDDARQLRNEWLAALCADIATLRAQGKRITVVSSGAVALGTSDVGQPRGAAPLSIKQAAAATGQVALAQAWRGALSAAGCGSAQVLLTPQDTEDRRRHLNARATLDTLAAAGIVPVINENDTVATDELRYGDNDRLAARVAQMIGADLLVLLSDVDGLYDADPALVPGARHIAHVARIDDVIALAGDSSRPHGTGGMRSKLAAARIATGAGAAVLVASGREPGPLAALARGARATRFDAAVSVPDARRRWILASLRRAAAVAIDDGAADALARGGSLLPVGVTTIDGEFERGDCITIRGRDSELGIGLAMLGSAETREAIAAARGGARTPPLVHRDDLVLHRED